MWSYNSFYDDPNNVLMHSSHKYIKREYKNGHYVYTYPDDLKTKGHRENVQKDAQYRQAKPMLLYTRDKITPRQWLREYSDDRDLILSNKRKQKKQIERTKSSANTKMGSIVNNQIKTALDPNRRNAQSSREAAIQDAAKRTQEKNRLDAREKADNTLDAATIKNNFQNEIKRQLARARNRDEALKIMNELGEKYGFNGISKKEYEELSKKDKVKQVKLDAFEDMYSEIFWGESVSPMASDHDLYDKEKRNKSTFRYGKL